MVDYDLVNAEHLKHAVGGLSWSRRGGSWLLSSRPRLRPSRSVLDPAGVIGGAGMVMADSWRLAGACRRRRRRRRAKGHGNRLRSLPRYDQLTDCLGGMGQRLKSALAG